MKVNISQNLKTLDGKTMKDVDSDGKAIDATVKLIIVNAILSPIRDETGVDKLKKFELAKKVYASDEVDLNEDEIKLIKDRVGEVYPPLVVGQIYELLRV